jgi:hypothetical protein
MNNPVNSLHKTPLLSIEICPNPTSDWLKIYLPEIKIQHIELFYFQGKLYPKLPKILAHLRSNQMAYIGSMSFSLALFFDLTLNPSPEERDLWT